ncbi:MAG: IPT/TIG domain-containing protein, partial [Opitutaceae bacterium]|nr:IPT/TIG domain-containing protein [Opitutaceae bacterium]
MKTQFPCSGDPAFPARATTRLRTLALLVAPFLALAPAFAEITLHGIFQDNMVLQRDKPVVVWGWGKSAGETVTVTLKRGGAQLATATAVTAISSATGVRPSGWTHDWQVELPAQQTGDPVALTIAGATDTIECAGILVGDVWLCAGQSNMALKISNCDDATKALAAAGYPQIRHFAAGTDGTANPRADINKEAANGYLPWQIATASNAPGFSAAALCAAINIYNGLGGAVPIGIVNIAEGGTPVEAWMSAAAISAFPAADARATLQTPRVYYDKIKQHKSRMYNGKVNPLRPLPLKGFLWYQGEANARNPVAYEYGDLFKAMIVSWREEFARGELPFYYVQLPNWHNNQSPPDSDDDAGTTSSLWPVIRAGQAAALALPGTGMVVAMDIGETANIHPKNKLEVGRRLANLALSKTYGQSSIVADSAVMTGHALENDGRTMRVSLSRAFSGITKTNPLSTAAATPAFQVAGADGQYKAAGVTFAGDSLLLTHPDNARIYFARHACVNDLAQTYVDEYSGLPLAPFNIELINPLLADADLDLPVEEQTRLSRLMDEGAYDLAPVVRAGADDYYKHLGWPVATMLPDGKVFVMFKQKSGHHGAEDADTGNNITEGGRRIVSSTDLINWSPPDALKNASARLDDSTGMHAIGWTPNPADARPRLVVLNGNTTRTDAQDEATAESTNRVYVSDDEGATWTKYLPFGETRAQGPLAAAPHAGPNLIRHPVFGLVGTFGQQTSSSMGNIDNRKVFITRSTDGGVTWDVHAWKNQALARSVEPSIATWGDGHMVMLTREYTDYGCGGGPGRDWFYPTQHVYKYEPGHAFSDIRFTTAGTNIISNGKAALSEDNLPGRSSLDTCEVIYNPVSGRIEMIHSHRWGAGGLKVKSELYPKGDPRRRNSIGLWSIAPQDLLDGKSLWRFDGTLLERLGYSAKGDKDGMHPGGSIVDTARGRQHIFIYAGVRASPAGIYRVSRPLDTGAWRAAIGAPVIASLSPADTLFGGVVTITGSGFKSGSAEEQALGCEVYFNGARAGNVTVVSDTEIQAVVPASATNGRVTVRNHAADAESAQTISLSDNIIINRPLAIADTLPGQEIVLAADVSAWPAEVSYLWEVSSDNGATWFPISTDTDLYKGAGTRELRITGATALMSGCQYRYTAANTAGVQTSTATLTVRPTPLSAPAALAVDAATGEIYTADAGGHAIYKLTADGGSIGVFAGAVGRPGTVNGSGIGARFRAPAAIGIDPASGGLVLADTGNHTIRTVTAGAASADLAGFPGSAGFADGAGLSALFRDP